MHEPLPPFMSLLPGPCSFARNRTHFTNAFAYLHTRENNKGIPLDKCRLIGPNSQSHRRHCIVGTTQAALVGSERQRCFRMRPIGRRSRAAMAGRPAMAGRRVWPTGRILKAQSAGKDALSMRPVGQRSRPAIHEPLTRHMPGTELILAMHLNTREQLHTRMNVGNHSDIRLNVPRFALNIQC